jgi:hypothetical protein
MYIVTTKFMTLTLSHIVLNAQQMHRYIMLFQGYVLFHLLSLHYLIINTHIPACICYKLFHYYLDRFPYIIRINKTNRASCMMHFFLGKVHRDNELILSAEIIVIVNFWACNRFWGNTNRALSITICSLSLTWGS